MSSQPSNEILLVNPYQSHPSLTPLEADVLWEYAKLAQNLRMVRQKIRLLYEEPDKQMLAKLRILEKKMGLVLTLFKASVWGVINEQPESTQEYTDASDMTIRR
jgi:DASH complex subunit DAD3